MGELFTVPVLAALGLLATGVIGALATAIVKIIGAVHDVAVVVGKVEVAVNSEKTAAQGREVNLQNENALLRELIQDKKATASLLAQAVATRPDAPATINTADDSLTNIDQNTAAIEKNTKRTDVAVAELKSKKKKGR